MGKFGIFQGKVELVFLLRHSRVYPGKNRWTVLSASPAIGFIFKSAPS